jgi:hypothetical protein
MIIINKILINKISLDIEYSGPDPPPPPGKLTRINAVYYEQNSWYEAGNDFDILQSNGINCLSFAFYKPSSNSFETATGGSENLVDYKKLGELIQKWEDKLASKKIYGIVYLSFGGALESGGTWGEAFSKPVDFANNLINIHSNTLSNCKLEYCKLGIDLDIEDNNSKDIITSGFNTFITTLRAKLNTDQCPMQMETFSLVYSSSSDDHWMFDLIKKYGPLGTVVKNGYQYHGLMVDNVLDSGDKYLSWWNNTAYDGILPSTNKVVMFYHYPNPAPGLFPTDPDNLIKWIKSENVCVAWWEWSPALANGGAVDLNNMKLICNGGGFLNCS